VEARPVPAGQGGAGAISARRALGGLLVIVCLASALAGRLVYLARPFDSDAAIFIYMGKLVTEGARYGHDIVDNKFPTVGLITSAPWRVFGDCWAGYVLLQTALAVAAAFYLARAAGRWLGPHARRPTLLFALVYLNFTAVVFGGFQLETLQITFTTLAGAAALGALDRDDWRDSLLVGLAAATAAMMKPTGLGVAAAFALAMLLRHRRHPGRLVVHLGACGLGLLIPAVCVLRYLLASDILGDMPALCRQIARYAANSATDPWDLVKLLVVLVLGGFPFLIRGWVFRRPHNRLRDDFEVKAASRPFVQSPPHHQKSKILFLLVWLALATAGVIAQHRMYAYHFMVMVPPLALLFGALPRRDRLLPLAAALLPIAFFSLWQAGVTLQLSAAAPARLALGDYLHSRTLPGDYVWSDDVPRLLLETGLRSATRHPLTFLFANWDTAPLEYSRSMLADFRAHRPVYLILPADMDRYLDHQVHNIAELAHFPQRARNYRTAWRRIESYARAHYRLEAHLGEQAIWRCDTLRPMAPNPHFAHSD
jgi:hypothetical protein